MHRVCGGWRSALAKVEGVQEVGVNLATERATVTYDPAVTDLSRHARRS